MRRSTRLAEKKESERIAEEEEKKKVEQEKSATFDLDWTDIDDNFIILDGENIKGSSKIAAFDLDSTLIATKSGKKFPTSRKDWVWWDDSVPSKLNSLSKDGYKIVIFTNQGGLEKNKISKTDITGKILDIVKLLRIPIQVFISGGEGLYHKPSTNMWDYMISECNYNIKPDMKVSFYCGDAAGRPKDWKKGAKRDFSCSDRKFAANVGVTFYTPEEIFLEDNYEAPFDWGSVNPLVICQDIPQQTNKIVKYHASELEMIIMVGPPASGKSTFTERHLVSNGYQRVNRDTLGSAAKCLKVAQEALTEGMSVVIDNTNPSSSARADFISLAKKMRVPIRCFYMNTGVELAEHLNYVRVRESGGKIRRIPDIAYNVYKKNFEEPSASEGFSDIIQIEFVPDFRGDVEFEKIFKQWT